MHVLISPNVSFFLVALYTDPCDIVCFIEIVLGSVLLVVIVMIIIFVVLLLLEEYFILYWIHSYIHTVHYNTLNNRTAPTTKHAVNCEWPLLCIFPFIILIIFVHIVPVLISFEPPDYNVVHGDDVTVCLVISEGKLMSSTSIIVHLNGTSIPKPLVKFFVNDTKKCIIFHTMSLKPGNYKVIANVSPLPSDSPSILINSTAMLLVQG